MTKPDVKSIITTCKICEKVCSNNQVLARHLTKYHNMTSKEYYDKFIKKQNEGICPCCNKSTTFRGITEGYLKHCSLKCSANDIDTKRKIEQTNLNRYGTKIYVKSKDFHEKTIKTNNERYGNNWFIGSDIGKAKVISANQKKYKVNYPLENPEIKNKADLTQIDLYGSIFINSSDFTEKSKTTNNLKYGTDYYIQTNEFAEKSYESKQNKKRYGMNTEDACYKILNSIYLTKRQYKSNVYPFYCDFYIHKLDLYIELNIFWTHGCHYFNSSDINDIKILNFWKSKNDNYYNSAIYNWTIRDIKKKKYAINNKLNFVALWNIKQFNTFISDLYNNVTFIGFTDYNEKE